MSNRRRGLRNNRKRKNSTEENDDKALKLLSIIVPIFIVAFILISGANKIIQNNKDEEYNMKIQNAFNETKEQLQNTVNIKVNRNEVNEFSTNDVENVENTLSNETIENENAENKIEE